VLHITGEFGRHAQALADRASEYLDPPPGMRGRSPSSVVACVNTVTT
jgi:hypothetical protein